MSPAGTGGDGLQDRWHRSSVTLDFENERSAAAGMKTVADLVADPQAGDRVHVQARVCKDDLKDPTAKPQLTASKVISHPAKTENDEEDDD